jgi:hypothetical protein
MTKMRLLACVWVAACLAVMVYRIADSPTPPPGVSEENARRIRTDATLREVEALFGGPPVSTVSLSSLKQLRLAGGPPAAPPSPPPLPPGEGPWAAHWEGPEGRARVCFHSGRAYLVVFTDADGREVTHLSPDSTSVRLWEVLRRWRSAKQQRWRPATAVDARLLTKSSTPLFACRQPPEAPVIGRSIDKTSAHRICDRKKWKSEWDYSVIRYLPM